MCKATQQRLSVIVHVYLAVRGMVIIGCGGRLVLSSELKLHCDCPTWKPLPSSGVVQAAYANLVYVDGHDVCESADAVERTASVPS